MNSEPIIENKLQTEICKDVADFMIETDDFYIGCVANVPEYKSMPPVLIENILHQGHTMLLYDLQNHINHFYYLCYALPLLQAESGSAINVLKEMFLL